MLLFSRIMLTPCIWKTILFILKLCWRFLFEIMQGKPTREIFQHFCNSPYIYSNFSICFHLEIKFIHPYISIFYLITYFASVLFLKYKYVPPKLMKIREIKFLNDRKHNLKKNILRYRICSHLLSHRDSSNKKKGKLRLPNTCLSVNTWY